MSYDELFNWFMAESVILSAIIGALITFVIYKITENKPKKSVKRVVVVNDGPDEAELRIIHDRLFTSILAGELDVK